MYMDYTEQDAQCYTEQVLYGANTVLYGSSMASKRKGKGEIAITYDQYEALQTEVRDSRRSNYTTIS